MAPHSRRRPNANQQGLTRAAHKTGQTRLSFLSAVGSAPQPPLPLAIPAPLAPPAQVNQRSGDNTGPKTVVVEDDEPAPKRSKLGSSSCTRELRHRPGVGQKEAIAGNDDAQDADAQDEDNQLPPVSAEYAAARAEFEAADVIKQWLLPRLSLEMYRPREYADDWTPSNFHDLVLYVIRGFKLWTSHANGRVYMLISAYGTAESFTSEYCERVKATSLRLYEILDDCLERGVPWKLIDVLDCLPDALDPVLCGDVVSNYLCGLDDLNGVFESLAAYAGSC